MSIEMIRVSDFAKVKGGKRLPKGADLLDEPTEHAYIRVTDMLNDGIDGAQVKYIDKKTHESIRRYTISADDVYISIAGTIGRVGMVPQSFHLANLTENAAKITEIDSRFNPRFLMYFLRTRHGQGQIASKAGGTSQPKLALYRIEEIECPSLSRDAQDQIVEVVKVYDDLIENNKRRIELLEDSARQLYKEWFVRFRFPGHEHVKIVDGVPEGWQRGSVGDIASVFSGYAFKSKDWIEEGNPVIKIKNITEQNAVDISDCQCVDDNVAEKAVKFKLLAGDMLIAMTGATVGKVGLLPSSDRTFYLNQRVGKFVSKIERNAISLLLPFFNSEKAQASIDNLAGGAAQPNISAKQIESIELPIPPRSILNTYLDEVDAWFELRSNLVDQNLRLAQARDILLPKLMNGKIAV